MERIGLFPVIRAIHLQKKPLKTIVKNVNKKTYMINRVSQDRLIFIILIFKMPIIHKKA